MADLQICSHQARSVITYTLPSGEGRTVVDSHSLAMGLPLTVNVQDFFRPKWFVFLPALCSSVPDQQPHLTLHTCIRRWGTIAGGICHSR